MEEVVVTAVIAAGVADIQVYIVVALEGVDIAVAVEEELCILVAVEELDVPVAEERLDILLASGEGEDARRFLVPGRSLRGWET